MKMLRKMLDEKHEIQDCILNNGMQIAVSKYTLKKLLEFAILTKLDNAELYTNSDSTGLIPSVYTKTGEYLGQMTILLGPCYKKLGGVEVPCLNGNVLLSKQKDTEGNVYPSTTYGVFDKTGKQLVPYGRYFSYEFIPDGVALCNGYGNEDINVITIYYTGDIREEDYFYIEEVFNKLKTGNREFAVCRKNGRLAPDTQIIELTGIDNSNNATI